jgi:recombination protein RecA
VQKSGSYFKYQGETLGQGKEKAVQALQENPELARTIREQVMQAVKGEPGRVPTLATEGDEDA